MKPMCGRLRLRTSDHHAAFPPPRHGAWHVRSSFIEMTQTCSRIRLSILAAGSHAELQHAQRATRPACSSLSHLSQLVMAPVRVLAAARAAARAADTFTRSSLVVLRVAQLSIRPRLRAAAMLLSASQPASQSPHGSRRRPPRFHLKGKARFECVAVQRSCPLAILPLEHPCS